VHCGGLHFNHALCKVTLITQVKRADPALWEAFFGGGFCHHCGAQGTATRPLKRCAGCQRVTYCSKECQAAAFWHHRRAVAVDGSHAGCDRAGAGSRRDRAAPNTATAFAAAQPPPPPPPPRPPPPPPPLSAPVPAVESSSAAPLRPQRTPRMRARAACRAGPSA
jgi:hypothetical protein